jgi:hypothetical protein
MLQRVNKQSQHSQHDSKLCSLSVNLEKVEENASLRILKPEEILVKREESEKRDIWTCSATLKEFAFVKSSGRKCNFDTFTFILIQLST